MLLGYVTKQKGYRLYDLGSTAEMISTKLPCLEFRRRRLLSIMWSSKLKRSQLYIEEIVTPNSVPEEISVHEQLGKESTAPNPIVSETVLHRST